MTAAQAPYSAAQALSSAAQAQGSAAQAPSSAAQAPYSAAQALYSAAQAPYSAAQAARCILLYLLGGTGCLTGRPWLRGPPPERGKRSFWGLGSSGKQIADCNPGRLQETRRIGMTLHSLVAPGGPADIIVGGQIVP